MTLDEIYERKQKGLPLTDHELRRYKKWFTFPPIGPRVDNKASEKDNTDIINEESNDSETT